MSTTGTVARILSVLFVLAGSALASPVVGRDNIFECIYDKTIKFTSNQAADMRVKGPACYPPGVDPKDFGVFLEDCCNKADPNHKSTGSPDFYNAVPGDQKAADNVDKLSAPGERLSSTHVDPSAHDDDPSSHANANVDSSSQNGNANANGNANFDPSLRTGEKNPLENASNGLRTGGTGENAHPNTLEKASDGLRTGQKADPNADEQLFPNAVHLTSHNVDPSFPSAHTNADNADANVDPSSPSQHGNANANLNGNSNTDGNPSLRTGEKNLENASNDLRTGVKPTNEQNAADSLPVLSAPQKDVAVNHQSTTSSHVDDSSPSENTNANVDPSFPSKNGNANANVDQDASNSLNLAKDVAGERHSLAVLSDSTVPHDDPAHSQSSTHADANTDAQSPAVEKMLGAIGSDGKCKCPL